MKRYLDIRGFTEPTLMQTLVAHKNESDTQLILICTNDDIESILTCVKVQEIGNYIELSGFSDTPQQRTLDEVILENRTRTLTNVGKEKCVSLTEKASIRTRPRLVKQSLQLDLDVEQQAEQEIQQEIQQENVQEQVVKSKKISVIDYETFLQLYATKGSTLTTRQEVFQLWHRVLATVAVIEDENKNKIIDVTETHPKQLRAYDLNKATKSEKHLQITGMTRDAAVKIIQHAPQFAYGLDWKYLPVGFKKVATTSKPNDVFWQFEDSGNTRSHAFLLQLTKREAPYGIAASTADALLDEIEDKKIRESLQKTHQALKDANIYDKSDLAYFRAYLPQLIAMNYEVLSALLFLSVKAEKASIDGVRLGFYLENWSKCYEYCIKERFDIEQDLIIPSQFVDDFNEDFKQALLRFSQGFKKQAFSLLKQPWFMRLDADVAELVAHLNQHYQFSVSKLNLLWQVEAIRGKEALLETLHTLLNLHRDFSADAHFLIQHLHNFQLLTNSKRLHESVLLLSGMSRAEKTWWLVLFEQHTNTCGKDDVFMLLDCFHYFKHQIKALGLTFYEPVAFNQVRSLPVALARMLRILNNCEARDLVEQWTCITALPLQANGAIRAIEDSCFSTACGFVLPEMQLTATEYDRTRGGYNSVLRKEGIPARDPFDLHYFEPSGSDFWYYLKSNVNKIRHDAHKKFFRFIAWQASRGDVAFYRKGLQLLKKHHSMWNLEMFSKVYYDHMVGILAGATTGALNAELAQTKSEMVLNHFKQLLVRLKKMPNLPILLYSVKEMVKLFFTFCYFNIKNTPNFETLLGIMSLQEKLVGAFQASTILGLFFPEKRSAVSRQLELFKFFCVPKGLGNDHLHTIFQSMRFYKKLNEKKLLQHMRDIKALGREIIGDWYFTLDDKILSGRAFNCLWKPQWRYNWEEGMYQYLDLNRPGLTAFQYVLPLLSTFNLTKKTLPQLDRTFLSGKTCFYALTLLKNMTRNNGLNVDKLNAFTASLPSAKTDGKIDYDAVHRVLKRHFDGYFDESFWTELNGAALDKSCVDYIHNQLANKPLREACITFFRRIPKNHHVELLLRLFKLANILGKKRDVFIEAIVQQNVFLVTSETELYDVFNIFESSQDYQSWFYGLSALQQHQAELDGKQATMVLKAWLLHIAPMLANTSFARLLPARLQDVIFHSLVQSKQELPNLLNTVEKTTSMVSLWTHLCQLVTNNPQAECDLITLLDQLILSDDDDIYGHLESLWVFSQGLDESTLLALAIWFQNERIALLIHTLRSVNQNAIFADEALSASFFKVLRIHANRDVDLTPEDIDCLLDKDLLQRIANLYENAPYPPLNLVRLWVLQEADLSACYERFQLKPCPREQDNGFHQEQAFIQSAKIKEVEITSDEIVWLSNASRLMQRQSIEDLQYLFRRAGEKGAYKSLVVISAELMYRSMGREESSHEINTTQYLAVYSLLKEGHVTGQIASGEGKTRVFMLLAACLWGLGKTVDFVTRNMALASRDFLQYQAFFTAIGAPSALIFSDSPPEQYVEHGIHFSDVAQLSLFRNQQRSRRKDCMVAVVQRALLLDEADQTYFDAIDTRYNFATTQARSGHDMTSIYPLLVDFFASLANQNLYYDDVDACNRQCRAYVRNALDDDTIWADFEQVDDASLEALQDAAMVALSLRYEHDFIIAADRVMHIPGEGKQIYSQALVVKDNRVQPGSSFANGVHAFLHARLNRLREQGVEGALGRALQQTRTPFVLRPENHIVYSTTSKMFLDDYQQSSLIALTGTAGNVRERMEAGQLYGLQQQPMRFIDFPRHNESKLYHAPNRLTGNRKRQVQAIIEEIKTSRRLNQPILVVCEDDHESHLVFNALKEAIGEEKLQRIHAGTPTDKELRYVREQAGQAQQVTVSTDMIGRGTDLILHDEAKISGLHVVTTYLASERDALQIVNRAGRYGAHGSARVILERHRLQEKTALHRLPGRFFTHTLAPIQEMQDKMSDAKQFHRLIMFAVTDFQQQLQKLFFAHCSIEEGETRREMLRKWTLFHREISRLWESTLYQLNVRKASANEVQVLLNTYGDKVLGLWKQSFATISLTEPSPLLSSIYERTKSHQGTSKGLEKPFFRRYDRAHDGFAARYDHYFAQTRAIFRGERRLFANTRAWWHGEGILFANLRAFLRGEIRFFEYLFPVASAQCQDAPNHVRKTNTEAYDALEDLTQASPNRQEQLGLGAGAGAGCIDDEPNTNPSFRTA